MADEHGRPFFWHSLNPYQAAWCDVNVGRKRQNYNVAIGKHGAYGAPDDYEWGLNKHIQGARGEYVKVLWIRRVLPGTVWHAFRPERDLSRVPDIDTFIDVKTATLHEHCLLVAANDPDDWAYPFLTAEDHPNYPCWGWAYGWEVKLHGKFDKRGRRPAHYLERDHPVLKDPELLLEVLRLRQAGVWK